MSTNRYGHGKTKEDDTVHQLMVKTGQLEAERKAKRDAEERCRQISLKLEHVNGILNLRTEELEKEKHAKEEAQHSCQLLQATIDKLEEYLRKKNTIGGSLLAPSTPAPTQKPVMTDLDKIEKELKDKSEELEKEKERRELAEARCQELEKILQKGHDLDDLSSRSASGTPNSSKYPKFTDFNDADFKF